MTFRYKLERGACPKSYGLHVAALAGIPPPICDIADRVGSALETRLSKHFRAQDGRAASDESDDDDDVGDTALLLPHVKRLMLADGQPSQLVALQSDLQRLLPALGVF